MITGDIEALYRKYLFTLGNLCHLSRDDVGALNLDDFATYIDSADEYLKAMKKEVT